MAREHFFHLSADIKYGLVAVEKENQTPSNLCSYPIFLQPLSAPSITTSNGSVTISSVKNGSVSINSVNDLLLTAAGSTPYTFDPDEIVPNVSLRSVNSRADLIF